MDVSSSHLDCFTVRWEVDREPYNGQSRLPPPKAGLMFVSLMRDSQVSGTSCRGVVISTEDHLESILAKHIDPESNKAS